MKLIIIPLTILLTLITNIASAKILTIYSDKGIPSGSGILTWSEGSLGSFEGSYEGITPPEGTKSWETKTNAATWAGWGVFYSAAQDFSGYSGGDLRFWIYSSTRSVKVEIEQWNAIKGTKYIYQYGWVDSDINQWKLLNIPLSDFAVTLNSIKSPFEITAEGLTSPATFYVDLVRWTTGVALPDMQIKIKRISDNVEVSSIAWSPVTLSTGWVVADCYIELEVDVATMTWGIQIYTDNTASDANPQYTGAATSKAGLIRTDNTTDKLPMGWTIHQDTYTYSVTAADPDVNLSWFYFKDPGNTGADIMINGEDYITVKDERGIHWERTSWGGDPSPDYIYLEANFNSAVVGRTYKTNTLRVELYYE